MQKVVFLFIIIFIHIETFSQNFHPEKSSIAKGAYSIAIGENANSCTDSVIVISDFPVPVLHFWPPLTVYYDPGFWYFKTSKGKRLLRYLDAHAKQKLTTGEFMILYNYVISYMDDIKKQFKNR